MQSLKEVILAREELEAVRLKDIEQLDQEKAAKKMNISQPTFHRILTTARKKITEALTKGKAIKIQGGIFEVAKNPVRRRIRRGVIK